MPEQLRVTEDQVRLRERPDTSSPVLYEAGAGDAFTPSSAHAWRHGTIAGRTGWMAQTYLEAAPSSPEEPGRDPSLTFDPNTPAYLQQQNWTCAIASVIWLLRSLGIAVTPEEAQDAMSPRYVNSDVGLLDASGAGIVAVLRERWGVGAYNDASATFDEVAAVAGRQPAVFGLRAWGGPGFGHWSGLRGFDGEQLILANPAGTGTRFGHGRLSREQFESRGPASMVIVSIGA